jgi:signal peptidase I
VSDYVTPPIGPEPERTPSDDPNWDEPTNQSPADSAGDNNSADYWLPTGSHNGDVPIGEPPTPPQPVPGPTETTEAVTVGALAVLGEMVQTLLLALVIFLLIRNVIQNFRIDGISMEPNLHDGQFLIINRFAYCPGLHLDFAPLNLHWEKTWCVRQPQRGDIIVFHYPRDPSRDFIKRVIGLPGEVVEIRNGAVFIDGKQMPEPFGPNPGTYSSPPVRVEPDTVYVLGDNRNNSSDSHMWGLLPEPLIVGKAWLSYWPPQEWAVIPHYNLTHFTPVSTEP